MQECAFLLKGLTIEVVDVEDDKKEVYFYENGLEAFVTYLNDGKSTLHKVAHFLGNKDGINVEVAFQYTDTYSENLIHAYKNGLTKPL